MSNAYTCTRVLVPEHFMLMYSEFTVGWNSLQTERVVEKRCIAGKHFVFLHKWWVVGKHRAVEKH